MLVFASRLNRVLVTAATLLVFGISSDAQVGCDGLWRVWWFGCDAGHNNQGPLNPNGTPICGTGNCPGAPGSCWRGGAISASGNSGGVAWSTGAQGDLRFTHVAQDNQALAETYMYVLEPTKTIQSSFQADVGDVWVDGLRQAKSGGVATIVLQQGWNLVQVTAYNQNQSTSLTLTAPFRTLVYRMSSTRDPICEPGTLTPYGCGVNPAGSLVATGVPAIGDAVDFTLANPIGTTAPGAASLLLLSPGRDISSNPCGTLCPSFGMTPPNFVGEKLVVLTGPLQVMVGPPYLGGSATIRVNVPPDPQLAGTATYVQGVLFDPAGALGARIGLTTAVEVVLGG